MDTIRIPHIRQDTFLHNRPDLFVSQNKMDCFNSLESIRYQAGDFMHPSGLFMAEANFRDASLVLMENFPLSVCTYFGEEIVTLAIDKEPISASAKIPHGMLSHIEALALFGYVSAAIIDGDMHVDPAYGYMYNIHGLAHKISDAIIKDDIMGPLFDIDPDMMHLSRMPNLVPEIKVDHYMLEGPVPPTYNDRLFTSAHMRTNPDTGNVEVGYCLEGDAIQWIEARNN